MKKIGVEFRKLTEDDLSIKPACFKKDGDVELLRHLNWCILYPKDDSVPHYYMRNMEPDYYRWGGIIRLGPTPLSYQTSAHHADIAQRETKTSLYHKASDDPVVYEMKSEKPLTDFKYTEEKAYWKEENILNVVAEYFPYAIIVHPDSPQKICYWVQPSVISGSYEGKEIMTLGCNDRFFTPRDEEARKKALENVLKHYIWSYYIGIREDGRKELAYLNICEHNGKGVGIYWLEGEEPIMSDEIFLEAEWHRLPYAPKEDTSVTFTNAVWKFAGKEIHFQGKWGAKGHTPQPRLNTIGLTHCYGIWYEGKEPRNYKCQHAANECSGATVEVIKEMGFSISE